ncbi:LacI family transcriptional regulator [bacterium]|nr:LacI family transcriptional regulator [bacterium]
MLAKKRTGLIGVIFPETSKSFFDKILTGIQHELEKYNYNIILCLNSSKDKEKYYLHYLASRGVDGIILDPRDNYDNSKDINSLNIPVVSLRTKVENKNVVSVMSDDFHGGYIAAEYLLNLKHKNSYFLMSTAKNIKKIKNSYYYKRYWGFEQKINSVGGKVILTSMEDIITNIENNRDVKAIFAANDEIAIEFYFKAHCSNIKIPLDISVIGYNNDDVTKHLIPPLTTINQAKEQLGEMSAEKLMFLIEGKKAMDLKLPPELIIRKSCIEFTKQ